MSYLFVALAAFLGPGCVSGDVPLLGPPRWLADGRLACVGQLADETLWLLLDPAAPGEPEPLRLEPPPLEPLTAVWSPDGRRLAYAARLGGARVLCVYDLTEDRSRPFATLGDAPFMVAWTRQSDRLAFARRADAGGGCELFCLDADGSGPLLKVGMPEPARAASWSPDQAQLAYVTATGARSTLFQVTFAEAIARPFAPELDVLPGSLGWSPDGGWLTFAARRGRDEGARAYLLRAHGRLPAEALQAPGFSGERPIVFTADGAWLALVTGPRSRPDSGELWLAPTDRPSLLRRVGAGLGQFGQPAVSPTSPWLALAYLSPAGRPGLALVAGNDQERVIVHPTDGPIQAPTFAPDGSRLAWLLARADRRELHLAELADLLPAGLPPREPPAARAGP